MVSVKYIYHDCFLIETAEVCMIFDYWKYPDNGDEKGGSILDLIPKDKPLYVFVSHHHKDHLNHEIFEWWEMHHEINYILSKDVAKFCRHYLCEESFYKGKKVPAEKVTVVTPDNIYRIGNIKVYTFGSTDIGSSFAVETYDKIFFHAGDLNAWIWRDESTEDEVEKALSAYEIIVNSIVSKFPRIDYAMFPVDSRIGRDFFTGAKIFVNKIDVKVFFPMHFELADTPSLITRRHKDAADFEKYANPERGEYIFLSSPGATYLTCD